MKAYPNTDVPAADVPGSPGAKIAWVIGKNVEAPNFAMRIISLEPGAATEYHNHAWEHEVYILQGTGIVVDKDGETTIAPEMCVYVEPDEIHNFRNTGDTLMKFICVVPWPDES